MIVKANEWFVKRRAPNSHGFSKRAVRTQLRTELLGRFGNWHRHTVDNARLTSGSPFLRILVVGTLAHSVLR